MRLLAIILMVYAMPAFSADISINEVSLWYLDNVTDPKNPIVRELKSLQDDEFWSKPKIVDIQISVENKSQVEVDYVSLKAELFYLLSYRSDGIKYPALENELKDIAKKPVWSWSRNIDTRMIKTLKPGETKIITIKNINVWENYYATEYAFNAYAIKVYASPRGGDENTNNNMNYAVVEYGD